MITRRHVSEIPYDALASMQERLIGKIEGYPKTLRLDCPRWRMERIKDRVNIELNRRSFKPWRKK